MSPVRNARVRGSAGWSSSCAVGADLDDLAVEQQRRAVRQAARLEDLVRGEHHRHALRLPFADRGLRPAARCAGRDSPSARRAGARPGRTPAARPNATRWISPPDSVRAGACASVLEAERRPAGGPSRPDRAGHAADAAGRRPGSRAPTGRARPAAGTPSSRGAGRRAGGSDPPLPVERTAGRTWAARGTAAAAAACSSRQPLGPMIASVSPRRTSRRVDVEHDALAVAMPDRLETVERVARPSSVAQPSLQPEEEDVGAERHAR